ncbi:hypothetical protein [Testudinibacter sp. TR-2022]|uniref:hypothetical protein n=1 Tax=Testudinibacter sp. TR-2022 TaxID=2585029 RepID=UPI00111AE279|nr:hypothetical protein [Testudinibacter sp. TR-2022]TNH02480.1 hypothetical protein FHQ30_13115 [Pasteurellaceae bacterium Phil11]TNH19410.1 hypothetical protein FHQ29_12625 [Testudinibacter sp. TR-2022]TNH21929.1 hypothetical protein FHQ27_12845 [Testudinibacter sp. TR-2022]
MDLIQIFHSIIYPKMKKSFDFKESYYTRGQFGDLKRFEFSSKDSRLIGMLDFWSDNWIEIDLIDVLLGEEIYHRLFSPDELSENLFLEFEGFIYE